MAVWFGWWGGCFGFFFLFAFVEVMGIVPQKIPFEF